MQTLWSRANRPITSSCRCKWCLSTPSSALRQSIFGLPNGRFQLKHLTTTLFYSSLIATAAAVDVRIKNRRREQWDRAIAAAERALHTAAPLTGEAAEKVQTTQDELVVTDSALQIEDEEYGGPSFEHKVPECSTRQPANNTLEQYYENPDRETEHLHGLIGEVLNSLDPNKAQFFRPVTLSATWPQSIYAADLTREKAKEETWVPKKLLRHELVTAKLAVTLLYLVAQRNQSGTASLDKRALRATLIEVTRKIRILNKRNAFDVADIGRLQYPQFRDISPSFMKEGRDKLKVSIDMLTSKLANERGLARRDVVIKIAYNLLVSPVPPDNRTYLLLLSGFSRNGLGNLADEVVKAIYLSHQRPDEMLVHGMLRHHRNHLQMAEFYSLLSKLQGITPGLMLAHPCTDSEGVLAPRLRRYGSKIYQSIPPDRYLFNAMIQGCLSFANVAKSIEIFRWMRAEGIEPDIITYNQYLGHFALHGDWERGFGVWKRIKAILTEGHHPALSESRARHTYRLVLWLCHNCKKEEERLEIIQDAYQICYASVQPEIVPSTLLYSRLIRRPVRILEGRMELLERDIHRLGLQLLASKIIFSGRPLSEVRHMFLRHADEPAYQRWVEERRHFKRREWSQEIPAPVASEEAPLPKPNEAAKQFQMTQVPALVDAMPSSGDEPENRAEQEAWYAIDNNTAPILNDSYEEDVGEDSLVSTPETRSPECPLPLRSKQEQATLNPVEIQAANKQTGGWMAYLHYDSPRGRTGERPGRLAGIRYA